ncbi:MAG: translation initiation factor IF-2, partial [Anaerolineae bacterium]|nr:translation initiation factor IF-2 [Anaerolineae bacterium]
DENEIVANPQARPSGVVLESEVDPSRGIIATLLVLNGQLKRGDALIAGQTSGRIKAMFDESNRRINAAGPSTPVAVMGLAEMPQPGDSFEWASSDKVARRLLHERREKGQLGSGRMEALTLDDVFARFRRGDTQELALIVKADYQGSLQPILDSLDKLSQDNSDGIQLRILAADIGSIGENDVNLAAASNAIVVGFNVDVDSTARRVADSQGVDIRNWKIIYNLLEDIELALHGMLEPEDIEERLGLAEVREILSNSRVGNIAGSYVREGTVQRNARARVMRAGQVLADGLRVGSLKRVRDDVREVRAGFECGISLERHNDIQEGDLLEFYVVRRGSRPGT